MIYIDTERLQDVICALESANNNIDEASHYLLQMTTHNNWGCRERRDINEYIQEFRREIKDLQNECNRFYVTVRQVSDEFIEAEKGISNWFSSVEALIGRLLSFGSVIYTPITVIPAAQSVINIISENNIADETTWEIDKIWDNIELQKDIARGTIDIHSEAFLVADRIPDPNEKIVISDYKDLNM